MPGFPGTPAVADHHFRPPNFRIVLGAAVFDSASWPASVIA